MGQEILIPLTSYSKDKALFATNEKKVVGMGFFPISYTEAHLQFPQKDTAKTRNIFYRKLFKEHFVHQAGKKFLLAIDPLLDMQFGKEMLQRTYPYTYQNTKGAQALGEIGGIFSFYTAFYENQARFVDYQSDYFISRGEYYTQNGNYIQDNATIPNGGRTKPFKIGGFDYASAVSYVRIKPIKQLAIQFGNMPRFFGWGYRSMLLSDNSYNYTNLAIDIEIIPGLTYTLMRGKQLNLIRKSATNMVESPYERKGIGVHYLSYKPIPSLVIGLFESTIYLRDTPSGTQRVNPLFYNPIIGINTITKGGESKDMKNMIGLNIAWQIHSQHMIYAQAASDQFKHFQYGFQFGYRAGNIFNVQNLFFQLEGNIASSDLYRANDIRMNYTHFNLPLAHTLGNGFKEVLVRASYLWKGLYVEGSVVYYHADQLMNNKVKLFIPSATDPNILHPNRVLNGTLEIGYEFNPATHLRVFVMANYYQRMSSLGNNINYGLVSIGLRSTLRNNYFDF
ncbi:MAG: hypothetical protein M9897_11560 [Brumimicrobium sp.]|nr:hypothetical protein [Brumimicrobium sp.]